MPSAEIISIGTELLLGEIVDTNAHFIARRLRDAGIDLFRKTTIGDNPDRIAQAVQEALARSDIILTTGGLGPTVDDPTRAGIAQALGTRVEYRPELWEQIQSRFRRFGRPPSENNKRQAYVPAGAIAVENPVGTAPAFIVEVDRRTVISLPGVPREMEYLLENAVFPYLRKRYELHGIIKARVLHTAGVGESQIDELIDDLERLNNPTVGMAAHSGQVDIRITAKANSEVEADDLIAGVETEVRSRLGDWIYGADAESLEEVALRTLQRNGWSLAVVEAGLGGELIRRLGKSGGTFRGGEVLGEIPDPAGLLTLTGRFHKDRQAEVGLGVALIAGPEVQTLHLVLITPQGNRELVRTYGGPPQYGPRWAVHHSLDLIRSI